MSDSSSNVEAPNANDLTSADEPAPVTIPVKPAIKYDGKIVHQPDNNRGKEDGWFLVKDGKRRWITEAGWLQPNGYSAADVIYITSEEFDAIPEDPRPLPKTGPAIKQ